MGEGNGRLMGETLYVKAVERKFVDHANKGEVEWHTLLLETGDGACVARIGRLEPFDGFRAKQVVELRLVNSQSTLDDIGAGERAEDAV